MVSAFEFTGKASFNRWWWRWGRWWMWSEFYVLSLIDSSSLASSSSHSVINLITLTRFVLDGPSVIILNHQILDLSPVPILLHHPKKNQRSVILSRQAINSSIWPPHYPVSINSSLNKSRKSQSGIESQVPKLIYRTNVYRPPTTTRKVSQVNAYCGFIRWAIGNYCHPALGSDGAAQ